jgi:hypothetical protein
MSTSLAESLATLFDRLENRECLNPMENLVVHSGNNSDIHEAVPLTACTPNSSVHLLSHHANSLSSDDAALSLGVNDTMDNDSAISLAPA